MVQLEAFTHRPADMSSIPRSRKATGENQLSDSGVCVPWDPLFVPLNPLHWEAGPLGEPQQASSHMTVSQLMVTPVGHWVTGQGKVHGSLAVSSLHAHSYGLQSTAGEGSPF